MADLHIDSLLQSIAAMPFAEKVEAINAVKAGLKKISPFHENPVECVQWVPADKVIANDYNPNSVAPPRNGTPPHIDPGRWIHPAHCRVGT